MKVQKQIAQKAYHANHSFIGRYQRLIKQEVIPYQYQVLCDEAEGAEKSHVIANFINAGKALRGEDVGDGFYGMVFQDSDAAKWLEAAAYSLTVFPDAQLEETVDKLVDLIAEAQDEDGYLNTYFTIKDKDKRWTNLLEGHELYCSGHMMEAACAYYEATGKDKLLKVMLKNAAHIYKVFVEEGKEGYPGHPEIELALMRMYHLTGEDYCLELAKHFVDVRGVDNEFFLKEAKKRDWKVWGMIPEDTDYNQSSAPVREQKDAVGHSVRAVYLYTGMADLASEIEEKELERACKTLWDSITQRRMYVTGGIGSTGIGEAFTVDYDLPGDTAYCETCASIGLMFFASRMLESEIKGDYADVMERAFYNTVLAGMQLDGKRFFYVNPLECIPGITGKAVTHKHDLTMRPKWYACACCPPNTARLISSFGKYAYGENADTVYCHLFAGGEVSFENGLKLSCETEYPYGFTVNYKVLAGSSRLAIHIPGWSKKYDVTVNGNSFIQDLQDGYLYMDVKEGDAIVITLDEKPYYVYASSKIPQLSGYTAVCRGPLVYCFEGVDNEEDVLGLSLKRGGTLQVADFDKELLSGTVKITAEGVRREAMEGLYSTDIPKEKECDAIAVPYYTWCNRGENQMRVWMNEVR
ncbi:MAG: glycoside hydrolase family 127 protein [Lachnospiraceae bacterium]|nr:glycoside hydrolase family 127 protein [Lachnospiraceae bacterium]